MLTLTECCDILHVDEGNNDDLIESLRDAIPGYIEIQTGYPEEEQYSEPLCKAVSGFILTLWYYADHADDAKLQRTINNLLKCIKVKAAGLTAATGS